MYVFSFPIMEGLPFHLSSARLIYLTLFPFFLLNKEWQSYSIKIIKNKKVVRIILGLFFIVFYTLFVSTFYNTYDYSIVSPFVNQIIALIFGVLIFSLFKIKNKVNDIPKYLIYIFIIQSIIQFLSFLSPEYRTFLNIFRSEGSILIAERYNYIRGLAISGGQFFSLGVGFGLAFIIYSYFWNDIFKKASVLKYLSLIFLFFGAMSAARSSLAGVGIAVFYLLINKLKKMKLKFSSRLKINLINIVLIFLIIIIVLFAIYLIDFSFITERIQNMSKFAFEFLYNFINEGELSTSSTETLFNRMYFKVSLETFLIGDGFYTAPDGSYYMHTDAGYMRNILYFGVIGFTILLIYQAQFFVWRKKKLFIFNILVMIYILVMHIKGDTLSFNIMMQKMLFLLLLYNVTSKKDLIRS
jgi:hypothetical protein